MRLAIRDATLFQAGFDSLRQGLTAVGLTDVEVALTRDLRLPAPDDSLERGLSAVGEEAIGALAAAYREAGMRPCALFVANNFNAPQQSAEISHVIHAMQVAETLAVPVVRLDGAMSGPDRLSRRRRVALYLHAMEKILAAVSDSPVALAIENHGRQGNELLWVEEVLAALPPSRVGLALDPANLYWAGYPLAQVYELVAAWAPRTVHMHAKNLSYPAAVREQRRPAGWEYGCCVCPLPTGDLDYGRIGELLAGAGYRGAVSIEDECLPKYSPAARPAVLRQAVDYLSTVLPGERETGAPCAASNN